MNIDGIEVTPEVVRELVDTQVCPWCERGPFKSVAHHTAAAHGISADSLREAVEGEFGDKHRRQGLCAPETSETYKQNSDGAREIGQMVIKERSEERRQRLKALWDEGLNEYQIAQIEDVSPRVMRNELRHRIGIDVPDRTPQQIEGLRKRMRNGGWRVGLEAAWKKIEEDPDARRRWEEGIAAGHEARRIIHEDDLGDIVRLAEQGYSYGEIATHYGCKSEETVGRFLRDRTTQEQRDSWPDPRTTERPPIDEACR